MDASYNCRINVLRYDSDDMILLCCDALLVALPACRPNETLNGDPG